MNSYLPGKKLLTQIPFRALSEIWELAHTTVTWHRIACLLVTWGAQRAFLSSPWSQNYFHSYTKMVFALHSIFSWVCSGVLLTEMTGGYFNRSECRGRWLESSLPSIKPSIEEICKNIKQCYCLAAYFVLEKRVIFHEYAIYGIRMSLLFFIYKWISQYFKFSVLI